MQYTENASQAANYVREAIPLMVKHKVEPNPRNFSLWYAYVSKRDEKLNAELEAIITEHNTCPPPQSADLFRRYIIDDEVDFGYRIQNQLSKVIAGLTEKSSFMSEGSGEYESFLEKGLETLQQQSSESDLKTLVGALLEQTRHTSRITHAFKGQIEDANREINSLREQLKSIQQEACIDPLTQINNRRSFDKELQRLIDEQQSATTEPLCLIINYRAQHLPATTERRPVSALHH